MSNDSQAIAGDACGRWRGIEQAPEDHRSACFQAGGPWLCEFISLTRWIVLRSVPIPLAKRWLGRLLLLVCVSWAGFCSLAAWVWYRASPFSFF